MKWFGRRPVLDEEHLPELVKIRSLIASIPPVPELARRWGISERMVREYLRLNRPLPKRFGPQREP